MDFSELLYVSPNVFEDDTISHQCEEYDDENSQSIVQSPNRVSSKRVYSKDRVLDYKLRRRVSQFPRILKRDFRRQIPQMYVNVLNTCDHKLLEKFINQFFHDNCLFKLRVWDPNTSILESVGRDYLINHSMLTLLRFPDITFQLNDASIIRTIQSEHCQLNISVTTSGSKVITYGEDQSIMNCLIRFLRERATIINGYDFEKYDSFVYTAHISFLLNENGHIYEVCVK